MRKIKHSEVKKVSKIFANIFQDYKAYDLFFAKDKNLVKKIYYFYRYEVYEDADYTYTSDDFKQVCSIRRPGDKDRNPKGMYKNPFFILAFYYWTGKKAVALAKEYLEFCDSISDKYYVPETDCYIKNIGVDKSLRGQGKLRAMLKEFCGDSPIVLETHLEENVEIYQKLGFEVLEAANFHGYTHYFMKRKAKTNVEKNI
ncbi:MAG: hypothetical protein RSB59_00895 [Clostridia bacterium]